MTGRGKKRALAAAFVLAAAIGLSAGSRIWLIMNPKAAPAQEEEPTDYSADAEIEAAEKKLAENPETPQVITDINTVDKKVAVCFEGVADSLVIDQILEYLDEHDMQATFFLPAVDVSEDLSNAEHIIGAGHDLESYTLYGTTHMETMGQEELVADFCRAQLVYDELLGRRPDILKCNATDYTKELMEAAEASGYDSIVYPEKYLNYASFADEKTAENYVAGLSKGTVISVKLSGYLDELEYEETRTDERPAKDKQPGVELHELEEEELSENERLLQVVDWLLTELDRAEYETVPVRELPAQDMGDLVLKYEELEETYDGGPARQITAVHTTDRETAFTFRGLGDEEELDNLLAVLDRLGARATFFVTGKEVDEYPQQIRKILDAGHEVGNGGYEGKSMEEMSFGEICEDIYKCDEMLKGLGVETDLFMPHAGIVTDELQLAVGAMGKRLILYNSSPARAEYQEAGYTGYQVVSRYYSDARPVLCRGDITYFNMDVYDDAESIADLVRAVWQAKIQPTRYGTGMDSILRVRTISELLDNTWGYPASTAEANQEITAGGNMKYGWEQALSQGYVGNPYLGLTGFSDSELKLMDQTGRIHTGGTNTIFLTFDDWGNEQTIGKLLYVLRKHNVKATFFIKTQWCIDGSSENLLRAIAADGHDIGSHTNTHMPIDIGAEDVAKLQEDLVQSNSTLSKVVGNTGALKSYFRPPTLAVNKLGLQTVFDCGYRYMISADISTADYSLGSADALYDVLMNGVVLDSGERMHIQDGSIVVMHINTNSIYTAEGLDRYLDYIDSLPEGDPHKFRFAKLSEYLK